MSDEQTTPEGGDKGGTSGNYTPPATQAELDRIISERIARERAKYADYSDLKAKAAKFDELTEAQKSEIQRVTERADAAERALAERTAEALRLRVAAKHGISGEYLELLHGGDEESLEANAARLASLISPTQAQTTPKGMVGPYVPTEGAAPAADLAGDPLEAAIRQKLGI